MAERTIEVRRDIRAEQQGEARAFREDMTKGGTLIVRLLSSPGSGKTTLLEKTLEHLAQEYSVGVLVGDVETNRDADRLKPYAPSVQITTGGACHLEIPLVTRKLPELGTQHFDFLFIEDVGNLICPASHDLGEHLRIVVLSVTEGDDKPGKYPKVFRASHGVVINKTDLLPYVNFSIERAKTDALQVQHNLRFFCVSSTEGDGVLEWCDFLTANLRALTTEIDNRKTNILTT